MYQYISNGKLLGYSKTKLTYEDLKSFKFPIQEFIGKFEFVETNKPFGSFKWINTGSMKIISSVVQDSAIN